MLRFLFSDLEHSSLLSLKNGNDATGMKRCFRRDGRDCLEENTGGVLATTENVSREDTEE